MADFHHLEIKKAFEGLESGPGGLDRAEAAKRLARYGPNELPKAKSRNALSVLLAQFKNVLVAILVGTGLLSLAIGSRHEAWVIFGAVAINVLIGFFQEYKADRAVERLRSLVEHKALAVREGADVLLDAAALVPGDLILVKAGNRLPADARVLEAEELLVDESPLTGESMPSHKRTGPVPRGAALADRECMVYAGTLPLSGLGRALVVATGRQTEIGRLSELAAAVKEEATPLQRRLASFSRFLGLLFGLVSLAILAAGLWQHRPLMDMVETAVAVGVAAIPEGLAMAVTFILALGMQRILKKKALTRRLASVETLGSATVIISDKTGTLTEGVMHLSHIMVGGHELDLVGAAGQAQTAALAAFHKIAVMANDAAVERPDEGLSPWRITGSPTDTALMSAAMQAGLSRERLLKAEPVLASRPFDSARKHMAAVHRLGPRRYAVYAKGAPEVLLPKCSRYREFDGAAELDEGRRKDLSAAYERYTRDGLRVVALAVREFTLSGEPDWNDPDWERILDGLTLAGFAAIKDPLRPDARETVAQARRAGIRIILATGDHRLTARTIAREIGLDVRDGGVIGGRELERMSDQDLDKALKRAAVFARVSPHHKLRLVKALQAQGEVVAMTGDGINDTPALKAADIGIALGSGTDIAKESSDLVLLDSSIATISAAIREGRVIFKNIKKVIAYSLSDCFSEIVLIAGSIATGSPLAILPAQILWINIVNDSLPQFALAFEEDDGDAMREPPVRPDEPLLSPEVRAIVFWAGLFRDLLLFTAFYLLWRHWSRSPDQLAALNTLIFLVLGVKSLVSIFALRSFRRPVWRLNPFANRYLVLAVAFSLLLLAMSVYWPPLQSLVGTVSPAWEAWAFAFLFAIANILLIESVKWRFKRRLISK